MPLILNGTTGVSGVDGTTGTPAVRGGDANTGVFYGTDTVSISTGGTTAVTVDSSQNVGIGVTPSAPLDIKIGTGNFTVGLQGAANTQITASGNLRFNTASGTTLFTQNGTESMRIDSSGNLLVNTTTRTGAERMALWYSSNTGPGFNIRDTSAQNGNTFIQFNNGATTAGTITSNGTTTMTYGSASDYRLKENIQPLTGSLDRVLSLKPVTYTWKIDGSEGRGFIAHELQEVIPECVSGLKDALYDDGSPRYQYVDQAHLGAHLVAAIQELSAKLDAAEARIAALEAK